MEIIVAAFSVLLVGTVIVAVIASPFLVGILAYWLICIGFGLEFNVFIPLGITLALLLLAAIFKWGKSE